MWRLVFVTVIVASTFARPEYYKENEDFQYSRSSTDEGSKSGFYAAQRGNVGGNYEKAHNMDAQAQNQLGTVSKHIEEQLGDSTHAKTGSVFTSGTSQGLLGSHNHNLQGHNYENQGQYGSLLDSQGSGYKGSSSYSSGYNSKSSKQSGYQSYGTGESLQSSNLQGIGLTSSYDYGKETGSQSNTGSTSVGRTPIKVVLRPGSTVNIPIYAQSVDDAHGASYGQGNSQGVGISNSRDYRAESGYHSQSGYQSQNGYQNNLQTLSTGKAPVKVVLRPESTVHVPIYAQSIDASQSTSIDNNYLSSGHQLFEQSEHLPVIKNEESSYSYRKEWERHNANPGTASTLVVSTPYHQNQGFHNSQSLLSNSQIQSSINTLSSNQHQLNSNAYSQGTLNSNLQAGSVIDAARPKNYQSSYSYHKSWEKQGDPYIIQPGYGQLSQNSFSSSNQYGSRYQQQLGQGNALDCDNDKQTRVSRSHITDEQQKQYEDLTQQTQNINWDQSTDLGQQIQSWDFGGGKPKPEKLEDFSQQSQSAWEQNRNLNQQQLTQQSQKMEDFGQLSQTTWEQTPDLSQQSLTQQITQQTENQWGNLGITHKPATLVDFQQERENSGQMTQEKWDNLGQFQEEHKVKPMKLEDLGQHTQNIIKPIDFNQKIQDLSQQPLNNWNDKQNQQQNKYEKLEDLGQQSQRTWDFANSGQQTESKWDHAGLQLQQASSLTQHKHEYSSGKLEDLGQQSEAAWDLTYLGQQTESKWDHIGQQSQQVSSQTQHKHEYNIGKLEDFGQQNINDQQMTQQVHDLGQQSWDLTDLGQHESKWDLVGHQSQQAASLTQHKHEYNQGKLEDFGQQTQSINGHYMDSRQQIEDLGHHQHGKLDDFGQQVQRAWDLSELGQQTQNTWHNNQNLQHNKHEKLEDFGQQVQSSWDLTDLGQQGSKWDHVGQQSQQALSLTQHKHENQDKLENFGQQTQSISGISMDSSQQIQELGHNQRGSLDDFGQQVQSAWDQTELSQQTQHTWDNVGSWSQNQQRQTQNKWVAMGTQNIKPEGNINLQSGQSDQTEAQSVWDKFDQVNKESTNKKDSDDNMNKLWGNVDKSQSSLQNNDFNGYSHHISSQHSYQSTHVGGFQQGSNHSETFNKGGNEWHPMLNTKPDSTTISTTPKLEAVTTTIIRPQDIGRGDIGAEDLMTHVTTITEPKEHTSINKPNKTPEEIEALSQTKEDNQVAGVGNMNSGQESLSVIGLDQQKWINEQKEHNTQQYHTNFHQQSEFSTTLKTTTVRTHPEATENLNQMHSNQEIEHSFDQQQQSQTSWGDLGQQAQTSWGNQNVNLQQHNTQQLQDFGYSFHKEHTQETQHHYEQNQDFYQQNLGKVQTQDTQRLQDFGQLHQSQQTQDFYNEKIGDVQVKDDTQQLQDFSQTLNKDGVQVSQKLEDLGTDIQQATVVEVTTTKKPGFWQSTKEKVSSWFSKS